MVNMSTLHLYCMTLFALGASLLVFCKVSGSNSTFNFSSVFSDAMRSASSVTCLVDCSPYAALTASSGLKYAVAEARIHQCFLSNSYDTSQPPLVRLPTSTTPLPIVIYYAMFMVTLVSFESEIISFDYRLFYAWNDAYRYNNINSFYSNNETDFTDTSYNIDF